MSDIRFRIYMNIILLPQLSIVIMAVFGMHNVFFNYSLSKKYISNSFVAPGLLETIFDTLTSLAITSYYSYFILNVYLYYIITTKLIIL